MIAYILIGDRFWPLALVNTFAYVVFVPLVVLLPIALLTGSRMSLLRLLPIVAVFITWIVPHFKPHVAGAATPVSTIRIVTFNTLWDNHQRDNLLQWIRDTDADILFLQEINTDGAKQLKANLPIFTPTNRYRQTRTNGAVTTSCHAYRF